ncbi:MAG: GIY-YIG nuclease family protein [Lewinellaceae bacterium]|nr:GIY-YIG nuclease family protein [Lewinellaceae bacterium]
MNYTVYILFSKTYSKSYVGFTANLEERLKSHNELGNKGWTIKYRPWVLVHTEEYETKSEAMQREKYLKSGVGREWLKAMLPRWLADI